MSLYFIPVDEKSDEKWILFDAPVDTLWIESMNSVMDDNKVLTLINGERISMPEQVSTNNYYTLSYQSLNLYICYCYYSPGVSSV